MEPVDIDLRLMHYAHRTVMLFVFHTPLSPREAEWLSQRALAAMTEPNPNPEAPRDPTVN